MFLREITALAGSLLQKRAVFIEVRDG